MIKVDIERSLDRKQIQKLKYLWQTLCNRKQYLLPKTLEDFKDLFHTSSIKIDGIEYFFTEKLNHSFRAFVDTIYYLSPFTEYFCYNTIYQTVLSELERATNDKTSEIKNPDLLTISNLLNEKLANREFYFLLSGLKFDGFSQLSLGEEALIFDFQESHQVKIIGDRIPDSEDDSFNEDISKFVRKNFIGEMCIKVSSFGDCEKAQEIAYSKARLILNYFRFLFCVVFYEKIYKNLIKVSIKSESFTQADVLFYQSEPNGNISLSSGIGRKNLQDFEIHNEFIQDCKENAFFDDFFSFSFKKDKTEIENIITTAIYWIGEAQADFDRESSFLKYWIALESIFTSKQEGITEGLCKGISTVLVFGSFRFIEINDFNETYKRVAKLYKLRCKIVHRGSYETVKEIELIDICKLSWQTVLNFFALRHLNYTQLKQVEEQTERLSILQSLSHEQKTN